MATHPAQVYNATQKTSVMNKDRLNLFFHKNREMLKMKNELFFGVSIIILLLGSPLSSTDYNYK